MTKTKTSHESCLTDANSPARPLVQPRVDVWESDAGICLTIDLPGADESSTELTLERHRLTVSATVKPRNLEGFELLHGEHNTRGFQRMFALSDELDREQIDAVFHDGVLQITIPRLENARRSIGIRRD
ncbi:MAG: Hsp20/alpha crystallin family protein [Planctomycetaceae bacterium]